MNINEFGLKEIYDFSLKTTYNIEIGNRTFEKGETVAFFDKIQLINFKESVRASDAKGGYNNNIRVSWESAEAINFVFSQGVFSETQLAVGLNSRIYEKVSNSIIISQRELLESDENNKITLKNMPVNEIFIYNSSTGEKITDFTINEKVITLSAPYIKVVVEYGYLYKDAGTELQIGSQLMRGDLYAEGKVKIKDDITGTIRTAILRIPRVKLVSGMSIILGEKTSPLVGNFQLRGLPEGGRGKNTIMSLYFLNKDIDSDL